MKAFDPYDGTIQLNDGLTLPYIWSTLHLDAKIAIDFEDDEGHAPEITRMEDSDRFMLKALGSVEASQWGGFCDHAGWSIYSAVALSWCKGASLPDVAQAWGKTNALQSPNAPFYRAARLVNPALLSETNSLQQIIAHADNKSLPICIMIAALKEPLDFDLPIEQLKNANPQIASFLKSRMEQLVDRTPEQDD